jgi:hypothetical protein
MLNYATDAIYENHHMLVLVPELFTHLLEIGINHEPCCHILCNPLPIPSSVSYLVSLFNLNNSKRTKKNFLYNNSDLKINYSNGNGLVTNFITNILTIDLPTMNLVQLTITTDFLVEVFRKEILLV